MALGAAIVTLVGACSDQGPQSGEFTLAVQFDLEAVRPEVVDLIEAVTLTVSQGAIQRADTVLGWRDRTQFTVEIERGEAQFVASALADLEGGGVALLKGVAHEFVDDGFVIVIPLQLLTPNMLVSGAGGERADSLAFIDGGQLIVGNQGVGELTWTSTGDDLVGIDAESCPAGKSLCLAIEPSGGKVGPGSSTVVTLKAVGEGSGMFHLAFQEFFETVLLGTDSVTVTATGGPGGDGVDLEKSTNGEDADASSGPTVTVGDAVTWRYVVTNTGTSTLSDITVSDDQLGIVCSRPTLASGVSFTCEANGTAALGQYTNMGTVTATGVNGSVNDSDPSHYLGVDSAQPSISVDLVDFTIASATRIESGQVKLTNQSDAETISVLEAVYKVEYRTGGSWISVGAACNTDPSVVFTFSTVRSIAFACTLSAALPIGSTVRVTAEYAIANRDKSFLDRLSKSF